MINNDNDFENWVIPDIDKSEAADAQEKTLFGKPADWYRSEKPVVEEEPEEEAPQPLTLDDIEMIRQSAYDDGFQEGKDAGFSQGLEEGRADGLQQGLQQGIEQGTEQGLSDGKARIDEQVANWQSIIERLHNPLEKLDENVEYQLVRLATSLAEQITRCEVQSDPKIILQALKLATDALPVSEQTIKILLHPDDLKFVQDAYSPEVCLQRGWDLQAEPALARGDCQIKSQASSVDYTFSSRIEQVLKTFFKENHQQLPEKNDDSNLLNEQPFVSKQDAGQSELSANENCEPQATPDQQPDDEPINAG